MGPLVLFSARLRRTAAGNITDAGRLEFRRNTTAELVQNVSAALFVGVSVSQLNHPKAVTLIKPAGASVRLKGIEPNRQRKEPERVIEQDRSNSTADVTRVDGHLVDPGTGRCSCSRQHAHEFAA